MWGAMTRWAARLLAIAALVGLTTCKGDDSKKQPKPGPEILFVIPASGSVAGTNTVAIGTGNFSDNFRLDPPDVYFGTEKSPLVDPVNPVELYAEVPPGAATGTVDVTVSATASPDSATCAGCYEYVVPDPCQVTGIIPSDGDVAGGDTVTITGVDFEPFPTVTFGTEVAPWASFIDPFTIEARTPPAVGGLPGPVDVTVSLPRGTSCTFPAGYTYTSITCDITSITPDRGLTTGGEVVTIDGTFFEQTPTVEIGGNLATNVVWIDDTQITCETPIAAAAGAVDVVVTNPSNPANPCTLAGGFTYMLPGACEIDVDGIAPAAGMLAGLNRVIISGSGFEEAPNPPPNVEFGPSFSGDVQQVDANTLDVEVPPAALPGKVTVTVTNRTSLQSCSLIDGYEYVAPGSCALIEIDPAIGPTFGGTVVTITGVNLDPLPADIVFGSASVDPFTIDASGAPNTVAVETPMVLQEGQVDVTYYDSTGSVFCTLVNGYEYKNPPTGCTITSITPNTGGRQGGTEVIIEGTDFNPQIDGGVRVWFGETMANSTSTEVIGTTQIKVTTPGTLDPGPVDVTVRAVGKPSSCMLADGFTYLAGCTLMAISPPNGPSIGGTLVTIDGANFDPFGSVRFGDNFAPYVDFQSPGLIYAETPPSGIDGPVDVIIYGSLGTQCRLTGGFTYDPGPGGPGCTIFTVSPDSGPVEGMNTVSISGTSFDPGPPVPAVLFGFSASPSVTFVDPLSLLVIVPRANFHGAIDVTVVNANGDRCAITNGYTYTTPVPPCMDACTVNSVSPDVGDLAGGNVAILDGVDFCPGAMVRFGGKRAATVMTGPNQIGVEVPPGDQPGPVVVVVVQPGGNVCYLLDGYTYQ